MEGTMEAVESPCSSDDEVLYGPVTKKEIMKTLELRRQTKVHKAMSECGDETLDISAGKEEVLLQNLTFTEQPLRCKESLAKTWQHRSLDIPLECDVNDDSGGIETPAPPPSPEFSRYNGSPYPTPCRVRQQLCNNLRGIAEEEGFADGVEMHSTPVNLSLFTRYSNAGPFGEWRNAHTLSYSSVESDNSLSVLSKLDDNLLDETSRLSLVSMMSSEETTDSNATESALMGEKQGMSGEERKIRDLLIEKMEQHEAQTQQLRSTMKQAAGAPDMCRKPLPSEALSDYVIILNDVENDFLLDEDSPVSPEVEILNDNLEGTSTRFDSAGENFQPLVPDTPTTGDRSQCCRFSRLVSERDVVLPGVKKVENQDVILSQSIFLGDECCYGRQKVDQTPTGLGCQTTTFGTTQNHEVDDASFTAPARPPSPEFDIATPEEKSSVPTDVSYSYTAAEYSLISEADDCLEALDRNCAGTGSILVSADEDGGFLSVLSEAALYHASLKHTSGEYIDRGNNVGLTENNDMCPQDAQQESHSTHESGTVQFVHEECNDMEKQERPHPLHDFIEEGQELKEFPGRGLRDTDVNDYDDGSVSVVQEYSVHGGSVGSCGREMDATSDLNDSDRRNIEDMKNLESYSEEEGFHDTLEEMEMLLKFGMDYMMSGNDEECPDATGKQSVCPKGALGEMSDPEDFGDDIHRAENHHCLENSVKTYSADQSGACTKPEVCVPDPLNQNSMASSHDVCGCVETTSATGVDDNWFSKPQTTPLGKFRSKVQAVVSPTVNQKICQSMKSDEPSPFKIPVKPALHGSHNPKPCPPRSAKKSPLKPTTMVSPCKKPVNYDKILSPVGAYIRNIPSPSLVTIVKPKLPHVATPRRMMAGKGAAAVPRYESTSGIEKTYSETPCRLKEKGRENVDTNNVRPVLPVVSYESVPSVKLEKPKEGRMPHLNQKMKRLVDTPKPHVYRHEGRVKVVPSPLTWNVKFHSAKKFVANSDDSYMASSDADGEISVVVRKQVTRSNTLDA